MKEKIEKMSKMEIEMLDDLIAYERKINALELKIKEAYNQGYSEGLSDGYRIAKKYNKGDNK